MVDSVRMEVADLDPAIIRDTDNVDVIRRGGVHSVRVAGESVNAAATARRRACQKLIIR